jgi:hypothetical protein
MLRTLTGLSVVIAAVGVGLAQPPAAPQPLRFKWQQGQTLTYKVVQNTTVTEVTLEEKTEKPITSVSKTNLTLTRRWTVREIDPAGVATLDMAIVQVRNEIHQPDKSVTVRDSNDPEHAQQMAEFLNKPIVIVRVDAQGRLVEVKEAKGGSAARLHAELPFRLTLPDAGPTAGQAWERTFAMKLDPPHGTGESYDFNQKYTCKDIKDSLAILSVETTLKAPPKATGEQVPLVPMLWSGEVYFNVAAGKYHAARLKVKAELPNHQGAGTRFVYESIYSEDAVEK